jgi:hypothetical protein
VYVRAGLSFGGLRLPLFTGRAQTTSLLSFTATATANVKFLNLTEHCQSSPFLNSGEPRGSLIEPNGSRGAF